MKKASNMILMLYVTLKYSKIYLFVKGEKAMSKYAIKKNISAAGSIVLSRKC